jgi:hypothetical protein
MAAMFLLLGSFIMSRIEVTCEPNKALQYIFNFIPAYGLGYGLIRVWHNSISGVLFPLLPLACVVSVNPCLFSMAFVCVYLLLPVGFHRHSGRFG